MTLRHPQSGRSRTDRAFVVCVHDVCPLSFPQVLRILDRLRPLIGKAVSLAVIPEPGGQAWAANSCSAALVQTIREHASEVLLHGLTHRRPRTASPLSRFIGFNDEFAKLGAEEAVGRVRRGQAILSELLGHRVTGFVPPGWRAGVLASILSAAGLEYLVQMSRILNRDGTALRLATWSWDAGPVALAGWALGIMGSVLSLRGGVVPVIALHPADVARGFLPKAIRRIERLLAGGRKPAVFHDLIAEPRQAVEPGPERRS